MDEQQATSELLKVAKALTAGNEWVPCAGCGKSTECVDEEGKSCEGEGVLCDSCQTKRLSNRFESKVTG